MLSKLLNHQWAKSIAIAVICILHIVGLVGIGVFHNDFILTLTWVNLLVTFIIGLAFFDVPSKQLLVAIVMATFIGILTEGIGVNTGYLFGNYEYGAVLGFKIYQVPFTIGLLWAGLNIAAKNFASKVIKNPWLIAFLASGMMVVLDIVMEPVATKLNFWIWDQNVIPIFNYVTWFFVSLLIQVLWRKVDTRNAVFDSIFIIQAVFFIALNLLL